MTSDMTQQPVCVRFDAAVLQSIRRHARTSMEAEICGVLLGHVDDGGTHVDACIAGEKAAQGAAHVTFTQNTWEHIYSIKDRDFPEEKIVGWYHSHPGFGVFLSHHDTFIHENFFKAPHQVAWVFDPHSDEEGCFGWSRGEVRRLPRFEVGTKLPDAPPQPEPDTAAPERPSTPAVKAEGQVARRKLRSAWERIPVRRKFTLLLITLAILIGVITAELILYLEIPAALPLPKATRVIEFIRRPFGRSAERPEKEREVDDAQHGVAVPTAVQVATGDIEVQPEPPHEDLPNVINADAALEAEEPPKTGPSEPSDDPPPESASMEPR